MWKLAYELYPCDIFYNQMITSALSVPNHLIIDENENTWGSYRPLIDSFHATYHVVSHVMYVCDFSVLWP